MTGYVATALSMPHHCADAALRRPADLVTTIDPKRVAAVFGMDPEAAMFDHVEIRR